MQKQKLKHIIREKIREKYRKEDVDEATTTGNVDGYQTPHAFSKNGEEDEDRIDKIIGASTGYTRVNKKINK